MTKFGYLKPRQDIISAIVGFQAISTFIDIVLTFAIQAFAGLKQTGKLNKETMEMVKTSRCGNKDVIDEDEDMPRWYLDDGGGSNDVDDVDDVDDGGDGNYGDHNGGVECSLTRWSES